MKKSYNVYNKEHVQDEVIFRHLKELSKDRLDLTGISILEKCKIYYSTNKNNNKKHNHRKRNHHAQKNKRK